MNFNFCFPERPKNGINCNTKSLFPIVFLFENYMSQASSQKKQVPNDSICSNYKLLMVNK